MTRTAVWLEWQKLGTRRAFWLTCLVGLVCGGAAAAFLAWVVNEMVAQGVAVSSAEVYSFSVTRTSFAPVMAAVAGALIGGAELRSGVLALTLLRCPRRRQVLAAKYVVVSVTAVGLALAGLATSSIATVLVLGRTGLDIDLAAWVASSLGHGLVTLVWGVLTCGLAVTLRSPALALAAVLGFAYVVEPAARVALAGQDGWLATLAAHLPFTASASLQNQYGEGAAVLLVPGAEQAAPFVAAIVLALAAAVPVVASVQAFVRQDVHSQA